MNGIIFFDGVCNLCNSFVQYVIRKDSNDYFRFCSLQKSFAKDFLKTKIKEEAYLESVIFYDGAKLYTHSDAVMHILKRLDGMKVFYYVMKFTPKFFRNWLYMLISKYRYNIWGKQESCLVPDEALLAKFIN